MNRFTTLKISVTHTGLFVIPIAVFFGVTMDAFSSGSEAYYWIMLFFISPLISSSIAFQLIHREISNRRHIIYLTTGAGIVLSFLFLPLFIAIFLSKNIDGIISDILQVYWSTYSRSPVYVAISFALLFILPIMARSFKKKIVVESC